MQRTFFCAAIVLILFGFTSAAQTGKPFTASFVGRMGTDTVLVETYTVVNNHLYGKAFTRVPEDYIAEFTIHFYPTGHIREFNVNAMHPLNSSVPFEAKSGAFEYRLNMNCKDDTCTYYNSDPGKNTERVVRHATKSMDFVGGWVPLISLIEWNCGRLARSGTSSLPIKMINHNIGVYDIAIEKKDKATMIFGGPFLEYTTVKTGDDGKIDSIDGTGTPWNYIVTKHAPLNIEEVARRMTKTPGIGVPSPTESITANIKGSKIDIVYGRPYKRGRNIFGGIVPYDSVWRTGANGPTTITLANDIKIQNKLLRKGVYSIYTIPNKDKWLLIFNADLKRWPTDPDRTTEVMQVSIPVEKTSNMLEQFTIKLVEQKKGGQLMFLWDDVIAIAEFAVVR